MIKLHARTSVEDYILKYARNKSDIDRMIHEKLGYSLGAELIKNKDVMESIIVKRERSFNQNNPCVEFYDFRSDQTVYEADVVLLTKEEYKEYEELKKFQKEMRMFVK